MDHLRVLVTVADATVTDIIAVVVRAGIEGTCVALVVVITIADVSRI